MSLPACEFVAVPGDPLKSSLLELLSQAHTNLNKRTIVPSGLIPIGERYSLAELP